MTTPDVPDTVSAQAQAQAQAREPSVSGGADTLVDAHGVTVLTRSWSVDGARALVLLSHGASEHSGRYGRFARALNDAGFSVAALDHRGHGGTGPSSGVGVMGPGGGAAVVEDLHALRAEASSGVPVFLFGHSMGSLIALAYLAEHADGLSGAVLCGFPSDVGAVEGTAALLRGIAGGGRDQAFTGLADNNTAVEQPRTSYDWLSRDPDEVDRYVADPLCGDGNALTYGYLADLFEVVAPAASRLSGIACPLLVIAGDQDPAAAMGAHPTALAGALREAGREVDLTLYEGARHELLNETNRDEVTADVVAWLERHLPQHG